MRAAVLLVILGACRSTPQPATPATGSPPIPTSPEVARAIADPLGFLPIDGPIVVRVDVDRIRRGGLWAKFGPLFLDRIEQELAKSDNPNDVTCSTAFSALSSFTVSVRSAATAHVEGVLVVRGLDRAKTADCLAHPSTGRTMTKVGDTWLGTSGEVASAMRFVDARTLVGVFGPAGDAKHLDEVIASGAPLRHSPGFQRLFEEVDQERAVWFVVGPNNKALDWAKVLLGVPPRAAFGSIDAVDFIAANAHLRFDDEVGAKDIASNIQQRTQMAKGFVDRLDVTTQSSDMVVDLAVTEQQLSQIAGIAGLSITP